MIMFDNDEDEYLKWVFSHPYGFAINVPKDGHSAPNMLHKASCTHITTAHKNYTTTSYKKLCSTNRQELVDWATRDTNTFQLCKHCKP